MRSIQVAGIACSLVLVSGCAFDDEPVAPAIEDVRTDRIDRDATYRPVRGAVDGRVAGEIGPIAGLDHGANLLSAYDDGYYMSVESVVELEDRAVMTLLSVANGADVFRPGLQATFSFENAGEDEVQVSLLGCVGQGVGVYDEYDAPADEVTVGVEAGETDDEMDVSVQARWFDRDAATGMPLDTYKSASTHFTLLR